MNFEQDFTWPAHLLTFTSTTELELSRFISKCISHLKQHGDSIDLKIFTHSMNTFPASMNPHYRVALVAKTVPEMVQKLEKGAYFKGKVLQPEVKPKICFLFPGYGTCPYKQGHQLYTSLKVFEVVMTQSEDAVRRAIPEISILDALYGPDRTLLNNPLYALIPQVFLSYGLFKTWASFGIHPDYVLGHSMGDYAAAAAANINQMMTDVVQISLWFSNTVDKIKDGEMAVVLQEEDVIRGLLDQEDEGDDWLEFSSHNTIYQHVVGGTFKAIQNFKEMCKKLKIPCLEMTLKKPFHTRGVKPVIDELAETVEKFKYGEPTTKFVSSYTGEIEGSLSPSTWINHFRQPVNFKKASETVVSEGVNVFVEMGANTPLGAMIKENMETNPALKKKIETGQYHWLPSITGPEAEFETMLTTLAQLFVLGFPIKWTGLYGRFNVKHFDTTWLHDHARKDLIEEFLVDLEKAGKPWVFR